MKMQLNGAWTLGFTHPETEQWTRIPAAVPGNVEIDMEKAGLLTDCMPADNEHATEAFESVDDWTYETTFDAPEMDENHTCELVFDGIDTLAEVYLNGELVCEPRSMHVQYRIDLRGKAKPQGNALKVVIRSALLWARQQEYDIFSLSRNTTSYSGQQYLRKARHEWGWDNAPRLLTSGIFRPVYIETLPARRFDEVYTYTERVTDEEVKLGIVWNYFTPDKSVLDLYLHVTLESCGEVVYEITEDIFYPRGHLQITVPRDRIALWWPTGFGEQAFCDLKMEMLRKEEVEAEYAQKWGVRTVVLEHSEHLTDDNVGEFCFYVNNERIYINGTNWKPCDALHSRADAKVIPALELVKDLHCNMVRIWGGGIYEDHAFFDYCDENGILVWQDFMFGCEVPPIDEDYCKLVAQETKGIVKKLRNHPSLAVWCGDNEDDECLTWMMENSNILPSDFVISRKVLRECVLRHDPYRSYVASSPYASDDNIRDRRKGEVRHHQLESHMYPETMRFAETLRANRSRFIGETGPISINAMTNNPAVFAREKARAEREWDVYIAPKDRGHRAHQGGEYFMSWRQTGKELCEVYFGRDFSAAEWQEYSNAVNIICGDVFKEVIEFCRTGRWDKTGVIWWSLMDMWPMLFNYSVVDCYGVPKLPYYWIRQSQQPFALMAVRKEAYGEPALWTANDTMQPHKGTYTITAINERGEEKCIALGSYDEAPNSSRLLQVLPENGEKALWIIRWTEDGKEHVNHFVTGGRGCDYVIWRGWLDKLNALYGVK